MADSFGSADEHQAAVALRQQLIKEAAKELNRYQSVHARKTLLRNEAPAPTAGSSTASRSVPAAGKAASPVVPAAAPNHHVQPATKSAHLRQPATRTRSPQPKPAEVSGSKDNAHGQRPGPGGAIVRMEGMVKSQKLSSRGMPAGGLRSSPGAANKALYSALSAVARKQSQQQRKPAESRRPAREAGGSEFSLLGQSLQHQGLAAADDPGGQGLQGTSSPAAAFLEQEAKQRLSEWGVDGEQPELSAGALLYLQSITSTGMRSHAEARHEKHAGSKGGHSSKNQIWQTGEQQANGSTFDVLSSISGTWQGFWKPPVAHPNQILEEHSFDSTAQGSSVSGQHNMTHADRRAHEEALVTQRWQQHSDSRTTAQDHSAADAASIGPHLHHVDDALLAAASSTHQDASAVDASCSDQRLADVGTPADEALAPGGSSSLEGGGRQGSSQLASHKEVTWLLEHDPGGVQSEDPAAADPRLLEQPGSIAGSRQASAQMPDVLGPPLHMEAIAEGEQLQPEDGVQLHQQLDDQPEQSAVGGKAGEQVQGQVAEAGSLFERLMVEVAGAAVPAAVEASSRATTADANHSAGSRMSHRPVATSGIAYTVVTSTWANSPAAKQPAASAQDETKEAAAEADDIYMAASIRAASRASQALQLVSAPQSNSGSDEPAQDDEQGVGGGSLMSPARRAMVQKKQVKQQAAAQQLPGSAVGRSRAGKEAGQQPDSGALQGKQRKAARVAGDATADESLASTAGLVKRHSRVVDLVASGPAYVQDIFTTS